MMSMKRMAALALAALLAAPLPALAQGQPQAGSPPSMARGQRGGEGWGEDPMKRVMEQLKLSPEQRGKVETIRARQIEATKGPREELKKKRRELFELIRSSKSTRDQAIAKQREVDALQTRLAEARLSAWYEARAALTADQLAQLEKLPMGMGRGEKAWKHHGRERRGGN